MAGADSPQECNTRESIISIRRKDIGILLLRQNTGTGDSRNRGGRKRVICISGLVHEVVSPCFHAGRAYACRHTCRHDRDRQYNKLRYCDYFGLGNGHRFFAHLGLSQWYHPSLSQNGIQFLTILLPCAKGQCLWLCRFFRMVNRSNEQLFYLSIAFFESFVILSR